MNEDDFLLISGCGSRFRWLSVLGECQFLPADKKNSETLSRASDFPVTGSVLTKGLTWTQFIGICVQSDLIRYVDEIVYMSI